MTGAARTTHLRFDVDKTYLRTDFDSVAALVRTFRQRADEKVTVPGADELIRGMLRHREQHPIRLTFISGSPRQMRRRLEEKFRLDGFEPDEFVLKPNLSNLVRLRFRAVHDQLGYKLGALLSTRAPEEHVDEYLFGDDAEQDALIYCLYADLMAGVVAPHELREWLVRSRVYEQDAEEILALVPTVPADHAVRRIFIHLDRRSPLSRFSVFGDRVVPVFNYLQAAVLLREVGLVDTRTLGDVLAALLVGGYSLGRLHNSLADLARRGFLSEALAELVRADLEATAAVAAPGTARVATELAVSLDSLVYRERAQTALAPVVPYATLLADRSRYRRNAPPVPGIKPLDD
jgi:hypothetical protein